MSKNQKLKAKPATDRIPVAGGAACPRCTAVMMQRYRRPDGFVPNGAPFSYVTLWDKCTACNFIRRLEEVPP
jgi:hypothetical protein